MNDSITNLIRYFSTQKLSNFIRQKATHFRPVHDILDTFLKRDENFDRAEQIGIIEFSNTQTVIVATIHVADTLTARSSKRKQYELAKRILKADNHNAGIFAFYDEDGRFRLSLVTIAYHGTKRKFSTFRRYTFFVEPQLPNKTFVQQLSKANFDTLDGILDTFSLEAVSEDFYKEFKPRFDALANGVDGRDLFLPQAKQDQFQSVQLRQDFALLFVIRIIFLGFLQKKGWLGDNHRFLQDFWQEYKQGNFPVNSFYTEWLEPLFFEALSSQPGRKVAHGKAPFSENTQNILQMAPYLNGELFKRKQGVDDHGFWIPDELIGEFFHFLFQYNFTVEENEIFDEELELNPEFLGIIFERLTNMEQGAVYTPRVEVDLMCRLALVKWLEQTTEIGKDDLYHLFFREAGTGEEFDEYQKQGDFSPAEIRTLIESLESVTVCDPAAGSGAFEVGMLQVLDQILENLYNRNNTPDDLKAKVPTPFERKKAIIVNSLYGVEVKRWAVWINHLRLWLTLFVDMPDDFKTSFKPLLPNLTFKVRTGDSLVQRIGGKTFPVQEHADLPPGIKQKITILKQKKRDFFYNKSNDYRPIDQEELAVFRAILDAEISERQAEIQKMRRPVPRLLSFLEEIAQSESAKAQVEQAQRERQIAILQAEIKELQAQKHSLKADRPFIWSIEFAEIFFDHNGFDIIIGNPPYLSAHSRKKEKKIGDPNGRLSPTEYKRALLEMVRLDFPEYFAKSRAQTNRFKKDREPNGRSDLYIYFYIRSLRLLNAQGVHVFICSNAWLDVGYGVWLQEFLLRNMHLQLVIDNHARRSFARADINTIITVISRKKFIPSDLGVRSIPSYTRFVAFKKPFEEAVLSDNLLAIDQATEILNTNAFRVYPVTVDELLQEGYDTSRDESKPGKYVGNKWGGMYLRAPDVLLNVLSKYRDKLLLIRSLANVEGYIHGNNINARYPTARLLESIENANAIVISEDSPGIVERGVRAQGNSRTVSDFLYPRMVSDRFAVLMVKGNVLGQKFYKIIIQNRNDKEVIGSLLNTSLTFGFNELIGHVPWGLGAISVNGPDVKMLPIVNPEILSIEQRRKICDVFARLSKRNFKTVFLECGIDPGSEVPIAKQEPNPLPDRKALDEIVFDSLGLTEEERKDVYRSVCQLVWERISKARSA